MNRSPLFLLGSGLAGVVTLVLAPLVVLWALNQLGASVAYSWRTVLAVDALYAAAWILLTHALGHANLEARKVVGESMKRAADKFKREIGGEGMMH